MNTRSLSSWRAHAQFPPTMKRLREDAGSDPKAASNKRRRLLLIATAFFMISLCVCVNNLHLCAILHHVYGQRFNIRGPANPNEVKHKIDRWFVDIDDPHNDEEAANTSHIQTLRLSLRAFNVLCDEVGANTQKKRIQLRAVLYFLATQV
ncbi:MAG TPA: hypothetical protein V6C97_00980 [Oculatellaceae cyanobacterium]